MKRNGNRCRKVRRMHCSDACFAYDDEMRAKGHWLSGEAIADASAAVSVRIKNGKALLPTAP